MTPIIATIRQMTYQEADRAGLHSRGLILYYENRSYRLRAGTGDTIHVFTRSIYLFVLTLNRSLGYLGLDAYMPMEQEPINTIFLHSEHQIMELLGRHWNRMAPETLAIRLVEYLM
jgi:hypothetical protein